jgi:AMMECR1 domain-containing protein
MLMMMDDYYYSPLFVTWNTRTRRSSSSSSGGGGDGWNTRLRGCIGTFDAQPLRAGLEEYALLSAFRDHRFRKVELRELPSLACGCVPFLQSNPEPSSPSSHSHLSNYELLFFFGLYDVDGMVWYCVWAELGYRS